MKRIALTGILLISLVLSPVVKSGALNSWYTDVPDHFVYYPGIFYLTQASYVGGYEDQTFRPEKEVNRVEALKMILAVSEILPPSELVINSSFKDVDPSAWYAMDLQNAVNLGIVHGDSDGNFRPEAPINRVEALKILLLATNTALSTNTPLSSSDTLSDSIEAWYTPYLNYAQEHLLLLPDATGNYFPDAALTRGELADLLYRFKKEPYTDHLEYGKATFYGYSFDEHNTASGMPLDTEGFMAAHKSLAFGTTLRITNLDSQLSVDVTVVDRGPYREDTIVDLTPAAFDQIGALSTGILNVRLEVLNK